MDLKLTLTKEIIHGKLSSLDLKHFSNIDRIDITFMITQNTRQIIGKLFASHIFGQFDNLFLHFDFKFN